MGDRRLPPARRQRPPADARRRARGIRVRGRRRSDVRSETREAGSGTTEATAQPEASIAASCIQHLESSTSPSSSRISPPASHLQLPLTEAQLTEIWRGRRYPAGALVTRAGVPVNVIFQGRPGRGPGPDFRGAVIAGPSGVPLRGDVELHVRASSFRAHGHHVDPAYAGVILHVVFDDDLGTDTQLPGGGSSPVVALAPWVAQRADELRRWLAQPLLWREPCHDAVMRLGVDGAVAALDAEGDLRFETKVARARDAVWAGGADQALYEGLLEALGYGGNGPAMLQLARRLPWRDLAARAGDGATRALGLEPLLLGAAGLLPSQRGHRGPIDGYAAALEATFAREGLAALPRGSWRLWGIRPANA
ncbi:MAG: DUF2851 family protein, partial [Dehalococcoidia bacterium]